MTWLDAVAVADDAASRFEAAAQEAGERTIERLFRVAGAVICLRFAGRPMADRITPPLAHLSAPDAALEDVELTVNVWDSASTEAPGPMLPPPVESTASGARYYSAAGAVQACYQPVAGSLNVFDSERHEAWYWCPDAGQLPDWEAACALRQLFHWWLPELGVAEVHGGAVGTSSRGVLLSGRGGSGKSTTALSTVAYPGLRYAGDDYVGIRARPSPQVHSLYSSGKLEPHHAERFPHLRAATANGHPIADDEKTIFNVHSTFPGATIDGFELAAILLPTITGRKRPRLVRVSPVSALKAVAPSTVLQLHPPNPAIWQTMVELVQLVPTFSLEVGSDLAAIPEAILAYLQEGRLV
jgi:hypothetical protein